MDHMPRRYLEPLSPLRLAGLLLAILLLTAIVVSASRPGETGPAAPPTSAETGAAIVRTVVILFAIGEAGVVGLLIWALWPGGGGWRRIQTRPGALAVALASFLQSAGVLVLFWYSLHYRATARGKAAGVFSSLGPPSALPGIADAGSTLGAGQQWVTVLIVLAALALAAGLLLRGARFRRARSPLAKLTGKLRDAVEEGLADLESEADPRRAVIAAYARMERALAGVGLPRARHETALEYVDRLLVRLGAHGPTARRLTELFQVAKFSDHVIDAGMQREAIGALVELRDDLRARAAEEQAGRGPVPA